MINYKAVLNILFALLIFLCASLIIPAIIALFYDDGDFWSFVITIIGTLLVGVPGYFMTRHNTELHLKEGFLIVSSGWILFALIGALPFKISGFIPSYTNAFFETMSGFTTTGASILNNIEALPHGLLFWRSFWAGSYGYSKL